MSAQSASETVGSDTGDDGGGRCVEAFSFNAQEETNVHSPLGYLSKPGKPQRFRILLQLIQMVRLCLFCLT